MNFVWFIFIGILSGLIAGKLMHGGGFGWIVNLIVGIAGGVIGGAMFDALGIHTTSIIGSLITSVCGAVVLLYIVGLVNRAVKKNK